MDLIKLEINDPRWKEFLSRTEHQIFHRPEYKEFIEATFKNTKPFYFAVVNEKVKMLFPVFLINQPLLRKVFFSPFFDIFKPKLLSTAFNDFGGPIGKIKSEYLVPLFQHLKDEHSDLNYIEIKDNNPIFQKLLKRQEYQKFVITLTNREEVWRKVQKHKRKAIKKSQRKGIITREIFENDINELYRLYLKNMRQFGELPYPKRYFQNFYKHFINKGLGKCFGAYHEDKLISILLGYTVNEKVHITIAVSDKKYLNLRPNDAVHWAFIEWACNSNFKEFDFGRTRPESGQHEYKRKWGGDLVELDTYYLPLQSTEIPIIDPTNPKYQAFIWIEQHLPLWFTKYVSSWFREGLGI